MGVNWENKN